jgi:quercetin dioxygenase-like cupin family protein
MTCAKDERDMTKMIKYGLTAMVYAIAQPAMALDPSQLVVRKILQTGTTISGQPIILPQGDIELLVSLYEIAPGVSLPEHQHPYMRYGYVLEGTLAVTNLETGDTKTFGAGDFIVEALQQWHKGANVGSSYVKLLVVDQVPRGQVNSKSR